LERSKESSICFQLFSPVVVFDFIWIDYFVSYALENIIDDERFPLPIRNTLNDLSSYQTEKHES